MLAMMMLPRMVAVLGVCVLVWGCGGSQRASAPREESNLKALAVFYGRYLAQHRGQPPQNVDAFKGFLATVGAEELQVFQINSTDELFISERDGQPFTVLYGTLTATEEGLGGAPVIAYEQQGVRGKRFVANWLGEIEEVDDARFRQLVPSAP
jgi:hypothetical protein